MSEYVRRVKHLAQPFAPRLGKLDIELTERCNNRCIHCYINQPQDDPEIHAREMDTSRVKDILQQAADLGCLSVRFTGGEPLLRDDFAELYVFARRLGLMVIIFTNARLVTPELAGLLSHMPPGKPVEVSVYGMHAESYDAVAAVPGAFGEFWQGINLLQEYKVPFVVKQSLLSQNRDEVMDFETFAADLPYMGNQRPGYSMNFDLRARRDNPAKNALIKKLRLSPEETLAVLTRDPAKYVQNMKEFSAKFMGPSGNRLFSCGAGNGVAVDAYGQAQMCLLLRHPETVYPLYPDLHQKNHPDTELSPLAYVLNEYFPRIRETVAADPEYLHRCARCFLHGLCEQCPAKSWEEHGTLDKPVEYFCQVAHAQARWLGWLKDNEKAWTVRDWKRRIGKA